MSGKHSSRRRRSPGEGSIVEYRGVRGISYRAKFVDESGRQVMRTLRGATNKTEAREALDELLAEVRKMKRQGRRRPSNVPTFAEYAPTWLERETANRALAPKSEESYGTSLRRLGTFFDGMPLDTIRRTHAKQYVTHAQAVKHAKSDRVGYCNRTISYDLSRLSDVLDSAVDDEILESNPCLGLDHPKIVQREWRIIRPHEVGVVFRAFEDDGARTLFLTLMLTTLRRMEILGLRWRDVFLGDPETPFLRVVASKTGSGRRDIALPPVLSDALFQHRGRSHYQADSDYVFPHPEKGTKLNPSWYAERFRAALVHAGIADYIRPFHDLRHSSITNLALDATNAATLQATAGHKSFATTQHYVRLAGVKFPDAVEALERRYGFALQKADD